MADHGVEKVRESEGFSVPRLTRHTFIKQFKGVKSGSQIVCFNFWELVVAAGCPHQCSYCFLQATPSYVFGHYPLSGAIFGNWKDMVEEVEQWIKHPHQRMLVIGELQDGLAFDSSYKSMSGTSLTEMIIPLFAEQSKHKLIFLTKSVAVQNAMRLKPTSQVIFSWSVNAIEAAQRWEDGAPSPQRRIDAAQRMKDLGWPVRIRLDPMIPFPGWQDGYQRIIEKLNELKPEMITLGALRASNTLQAHARRNGRDASIFNLLTVKDPSGFKWRLPEDLQVEMFRFAKEHIDTDIIDLALCKEDEKIWRAIGLDFKGCHCLLCSEDEIVRKRRDESSIEIL